MKTTFYVKQILKNAQICALFTFFHLRKKNLIDKYRFEGDSGPLGSV